jgi:methylenetetrahydrofolate dehydrogenase (NADP+)/methenyltetrahydrofolate cyclohydrolase
MAEILNGKKLSEEILENLKEEIGERRLSLKLAVIWVGEDPASEVFIKEKEKACKVVGIEFELFRFPTVITQEGLKKRIKEIVQREDVSGIVIQLPLPENLDSQEILDLIPPKKDVDVLSTESFEKFYSGGLSILPAVVAGVSQLLKKYNLSVRGKNVVLVGTGRLVGRPLEVWLKKEGANVFIVDEFKKNIPEKVDILISGVGKPAIIKESAAYNIGQETAVVDAGSTLKNGKLVGDVDFERISKKAGYITPVPGGVGPLTVACLLENLVKLYKE